MLGENNEIPMDQCIITVVPTIEYHDGHRYIDIVTAQNIYR